MQKLVNSRTCITRFIESDEPFNYRVVAEGVAKNIITEGLHNDRSRKI